MRRYIRGRASLLSASFCVGHLLLGRPGAAARADGSGVSGVAYETQSVTAGECKKKRSEILGGSWVQGHEVDSER